MMKPANILTAASLVLLLSLGVNASAEGSDDGCYPVVNGEVIVQARARAVHDVLYKAEAFIDASPGFHFISGTIGTTGTCSQAGALGHQALCEIPGAGLQEFVNTTTLWSPGSLPPGVYHGEAEFQRCVDVFGNVTCPTLDVQPFCIINGRNYSIEKTLAGGEATVSHGAAIAFDLRVQVETHNITNVVVTDVVPNEGAFGIRGIGIETSAGFECSISGQTIQCTRDTVSYSGTQPVIRITGEAFNVTTEAQTVINCATVEANQGPFFPEQTEDCQEITISPGTDEDIIDLEAVLEPPVPAQAARGDFVNLNARAINHGPAVAEEVFLEIDPGGLNITSSTGPGWQCNAAGDCERDTLLVGQASSPVQYTVQVPTNFPDSQAEVCASVYADRPDETHLANNIDCQIIEIIGGAAQTLSVQSSGASGVSISSTTGQSGTTNYTSAVNEGDSVSLTAPYRTGSAPNEWVFSEWVGCDSTGGSGNRTCTLEVGSGGNTVTANYEPADLLANGWGGNVPGGTIGQSDRSIQFIAQNAGPARSYNTLVTVTTTVGGVAPRPSDSWNCTNTAGDGFSSDQRLVCNRGSRNPGSEVSTWFSQVLSDPGSGQLCVRIDSDIHDPSPGNNQMCQNFTIQGQEGELSVQSSGASGVTISSLTGHGGTTNYTQTADEGEQVDLTAPYRTGTAPNEWVFSEWVGCDSTGGSGNRTCTLEVGSGGNTVTANYEPADLLANGWGGNVPGGTIGQSDRSILFIAQNAGPARSYNTRVTITTTVGGVTPRPTDDWNCTNTAGGGFSSDQRLVCDRGNRNPGSDVSTWFSQVLSGAGSGQLCARIDSDVHDPSSGNNQICQNFTIQGEEGELSVQSIGASGVSISSTTGHGGTTNYTQAVGEGEQVSLTAPYRSGSIPNEWVFAEWTGCDSTGGTGNRTCSLEMGSEGQSVTAVYESADLAANSWQGDSPGGAIDQPDRSILFVGENAGPARSYNTRAVITTTVGGVAPRPDNSWNCNNVAGQGFAASQRLVCSRGTRNAGAEIDARFSQVLSESGNGQLCAALVSNIHDPAPSNNQICQNFTIQGEEGELSVQSIGASGVSISSATGHGGTTNYIRTVGEGEQVVLMAPYTTGAGTNQWVFSEWIGCDSTSGPADRRCSLEMGGGASTVVAHYQPADLQAVSFDNDSPGGTAGEPDRAIRFIGRNNGPARAYNTRTIITTTAGELAPRPNDSWNCSNSAGAGFEVHERLVCVRGDLDHEASTETMFSQVLSEPGTGELCARILSDIRDTNTSNVSICQSFSIGDDREADLAVTGFGGGYLGGEPHESGESDEASALWINHGPDTAGDPTEVVINVTYGELLVDQSTNCVTEGPRRLRCSVGEPEPMTDPSALSFRYVRIETGIVQMCASIQSAVHDPNPENNNHCTSFEVTSPSAEADIRPAISGPLVLTRGEGGSYQIHTGNHGPSEATGVEISINTDLTVDGMAGQNWNCISSPPSCNLLATLVNQSSAPSITADISVPAEFGPDSVNICATASADQPDPGPNQDCMTVTIEDSSAGDAQITALLSVPTSPTKGEQFTATVQVLNAEGVAPAEDVRVAVYIPNQNTTALTDQVIGPLWTYAGASGNSMFSRWDLNTNQVPNVGRPLNPGGATNPLSWNITIPTGSTASSIQLCVQARAENADWHTTCQWVTPQDETLPDSDLEFELTGDPEASPGSTVTLSGLITNHGPENAPGYGATINMQTSNGLLQLEAVSSDWSCTGSPSLTCQPVADPSLTVGQSALISGMVFRVPSDATGELVVCGMAVSENPDPDPSRASDCHVIQVQDDQDADLVLVKTGDETVYASEQTTYSITVANQGPGEATGVQVVDTLPAGTVFASAGGSQWSCMEDNGQVQCLRDAALASGQTAPDLLITVHAPPEPGDIMNVATAYANENDPSPGSAQDSHQITVLPSTDLGIAKSGPRILNPGGAMHYTISVVNFGPSTSQARTVTTELPSGANFVNNSGSGWSCQSEGSEIVCSNAQSTAPGTRTPDLSIRLEAPNSDGSPITVMSCSEVSTSVRDPNSSNDKACHGISSNPPSGMEPCDLD
jgi:uncharacterized repeat protein (TIGR01451 family)